MQNRRQEEKAETKKTEEGELNIRVLRKTETIEVDHINQEIPIEIQKDMAIIGKIKTLENLTAKIRPKRILPKKVNQIQSIRNLREEEVIKIAQITNILDEEMELNKKRLKTNHLRKQVLVVLFPSSLGVNA
jgi:maltooligosyltrehalose synthase|tara:strand:- start:4564 stop:4959 length:396 start_codon:yes stop_codon:yes gene_type:complete